ncbi:MAG: 4Fe-4S binding protein [Bryobacterales bacterium]|nr:4Fe-4S binding protein [Bryobacterales bacterium]
MAAVLANPLKTNKKEFVRKRADSTQWVRRGVQLGFFALNLWIGIQFYLFVRFYETGGQGPWVERPPGVEGWLPIASLMNLKLWWSTGRVPGVHPAGMFLLLAFVAMSLFLRKAFCGWLCPVGTLSEYLWRLGRKVFRKNYRLPRWADLPLRSLKYILMGLFLYAVGGMSAAAIAFFLEGPYGLIADVKMLNFFRYLGVGGGLVIAGLILAGVFIQNFWCRYLCPYGAFLGLFSWASPVRIKRDADLCIDCAKCAKACPSQLKVDQLIQIQSPECLACYECETSCPVEGALEMTVAGRKRIPAWSMAAMVAALFLGSVTYARMSGYWHTNVSTDVYYQLVPRANEFGHP